MSSGRSDLALNIFPQLGGQQPCSTSPATSNPSPVDPTSSSTSRSAFGLPPGLGGNAKMAASRSGTGSPSHDLGASSRLYSKRYVHFSVLRPECFQASSVVLTWLSPLFIGPGRFKHRKESQVCLSIYGHDPRQAAIRHPSVRIFPNHRLMVSLTLHTSPPRLTSYHCPPDAVTAPEQCHLGSRPVALGVGCSIFPLWAPLLQRNRGPRHLKHHSSHRRPGRNLQIL